MKIRFVHVALVGLVVGIGWAGVEMWETVEDTADAMFGKAGSSTKRGRSIADVRRTRKKSDAGPVAVVADKKVRSKQKKDRLRVLPDDRYEVERVGRKKAEGGAFVVRRRVGAPEVPEEVQRSAAPEAAQPDDAGITTGPVFEAPELTDPELLPARVPNASIEERVARRVENREDMTEEERDALREARRSYEEELTGWELAEYERRKRQRRRARKALGADEQHADTDTP